MISIPTDKENLICESPHLKREPDMIFNTEIQHIVRKALLKMPEQSRNIFILSRYQNTPNRMIAEKLGISIKSVEFHITKALKILRTELKDYLISILL